MPRLVYDDLHGKRHLLELSTKPVLIGRKDTCDLCIEDGEVSREHAAVRVNDANQVIVSDRGSKNGTSVDSGPTFHGAERAAQQMIRVAEHIINIEYSTTTSNLPPVPAAPSQTGDLTVFPSTAGIDLSKDRLNLLMQLAERISAGAFDRRQLLEKALSECIRTFDFERGLIALRTARGDTESPVTHKMQPDQVSRTILNPALNDGQRSVMNDLSDIPNISESVVINKICSALCVPILHHSEILGVIYGDRVTTPTVRPYQKPDVDFLAAVAQQIGSGLSNLRLLDERLRYERAQAEIEQASAIQRKLLPEKPLEVGGARLIGLNEPSAFVSGDYYDYVPLGDDQAAFVIADVSGHGLAAAMLAVNLQAAFHLAIEELIKFPTFDERVEALGSMTERINRLICRNTGDDKFVTGIIGLVHPPARQIALTNGGHHPPIVVGDEVRGLEVTSDLLLGLVDDMPYGVQRFELTPNEQRLLFYTDGLIEAANTSGDMLGIEAVLENLQSKTVTDQDPPIKLVLEHVRDFMAGLANEDDMTLLEINFDAG